MVERECKRGRTGLLAALLGLAACGTDAPEPAAVADIDPANAAYSGLDGFAGTVTLAAGKFEGAADGSSAYLSQQLVSRGDLDGDGIPEAASVIFTSAGESGAVAHLVLLRHTNGAVENAATLRVGDGVIVRELEIRDGEIRMTTIEHGPQDAACCPTQRIDRWFALTAGSLGKTRESAAETLGRAMGFMTWDDDSGARFTSCDESRNGAVLDGIRRQSVRELYDELAATAGKPLFFDVEGRWLDTAAAGLEAPAERTLEITAVYRVEREGFGCELALDGAIFLGFGSEPAWRLEVRHDGAELVSADGSENVTFEGDGQLAARQFEFENDRYLLRLSYLELPCRDPMSGSYFSHTVDFTIGGSRFNGCAVPGR